VNESRTLVLTVPPDARTAHSPGLPR